MGPHIWPLIINIFLVSPGLISSQGAATSARARPLLPSHACLLPWPFGEIGRHRRLGGKRASKMFMETGLQVLDFFSRPLSSPDEGILSPNLWFQATDPNILPVGLSGSTVRLVKPWVGWSFVSTPARCLKPCVTCISKLIHLMHCVADGSVCPLA